MSKLQAVTPETFEAEVIQSDKPVIVDFWASWCGPCKLVAPRIEKMAELNPGVKVVTVDCETHRDFARERGIRSIPTLRLYKNGNMESQVIGNQVALKLEEIFTAAQP